MISSASRMVLSRWATIRQVHPRRRRLSSIRLSVVGSRALVASSRTRSDGRPDQGAGDLQPLPLAAAPVGSPLLDRAVVASRPRRDLLVDAGVLGGGHDLRQRDRRVPQGEVLAHASPRRGRRSGRPWRASWSAPPAGDLGRAAGRRTGSRRSTARRGPVTSREIVDLPLPEPPTRATREPGFEREVETFDQRRIEPAVAEGDVAQLQGAGEPHGAPRRRQLRRRPAPARGGRAGSAGRRRAGSCPPRPSAAGRRG